VSDAGYPSNATRRARWWAIATMAFETTQSGSQAAVLAIERGCTKQSEGFAAVTV
jgi:hypothetical protein